MLVQEILKKSARQYSGKVAVRFEGYDLTFDALAQRSWRFAHALEAYGVRKGTHVALMMPNSLEFLYAYFGALSLGATVVLVNFLLKPREVQFILNHSDAKLLILAEQFAGLVNEVKNSLPQISTFIINSPQPKEGFIRMKDLLETGIDHMPKVAGTEDDVAVIMYTSGTTGDPKGCMQTHYNITTTADAFGTRMDVRKEDKAFQLTSLFTVAGVNSVALPAIDRGATLYMLPKFDPVKAVELIQSEKPTFTVSVPAMWRMMLDQPKINDYDLSSLRLIVVGATSVPPALVRDLKRRMPKIDVGIVCGMTETSGVDSYAQGSIVLEKPSTVGTATPGFSVRVVDEKGNNLPWGEIGEEIVKGPGVIAGYYKNERASVEAIKNGWLYTGDLARFDEDGHLFLVDRKKDLVIRGGMNVYPIEIESVIYEIPAVAEVAIVAQHHEVLGEVPIAFVVPRPGQVVTEKEVIAYCRQNLAKYKVPVAVQIVEPLPRTASGKVDKKVIRSQYNLG